jgi:hypothetical protein
MLTLISYSIRAKIFHNQTGQEGYSPAFGVGMIKSISLTFVWKIAANLLLLFVNTQLPPYRGRNTVGYVVAAIVVEALMIGIAYLFTICMFKRYSEYKRGERYISRMLNLCYSPFSIFNCFWFLYEGFTWKNKKDEPEEIQMEKIVTATA